MIVVCIGEMKEVGLCRGHEGARWLCGCGGWSVGRRVGIRIRPLHCLVAAGGEGEE